MNTLDEIAKRLGHIEKNQEMTMKMVRLILEDLGLRKQISILETEMEAGNGSIPPAVLDPEE